jgi:hypothetical protein
MAAILRIIVETLKKPRIKFPEPSVKTAGVRGEYHEPVAEEDRRK